MPLGVPDEQGDGRPIGGRKVAGRRQQGTDAIAGVDYSTGSIGVLGQSSSRAPRTAASRVKRCAGSVAE